MNFKLLKKLARSGKYQTLYSRAKELGNLKLFQNSMTLTKVQTWFLYFLEIYSSLYSDLAMNEDYISEEVIEDDLRMEAYLVLRRENRKEKKANKFTEKSDKTASNEIPTVIFNRK